MQPDPAKASVVTSDHQLPAPTEPGRSHHKGIRAVVWIVLLVFFALGFFLVLRHKQEPQKQGAGGPGGGRRGGALGGPVMLTSATAQKGDIGVYIEAIGTVTPVYTSSITSQVNGIVTQVHYTEGQLVRKGDPLIDIDSRPYRATLMQAQGVLERDQGVLAQAQMDLERYQTAWARNAIPRQQLDDQEKLVQQVTGTVKNDQGTVQYDEIQVGFCHIVSPITGRVGLRLVDPGNVVQANSNTVLAVVTQVQPVTVVFTIAEDSLGEIQPRLRQHTQLPVDVFDRTNQKKIASGTLLTLDNQIDTTTGTVKARAMFPNKDGALFPNQFVNSRLLVNTLRGVTLIPTAAIQHNGQAAFVYVIEDNKAHLRPITVGVVDGLTAQVDGVNPGDVLATSSFDKLQDKAPVTISRRAAGRDGNEGAGPDQMNAPARSGSGIGGHNRGQGGPKGTNGNTRSTGSGESGPPGGGNRH